MCIYIIYMILYTYIYDTLCLPGEIILQIYGVIIEKLVALVIFTF